MIPTFKFHGSKARIAKYISQNVGDVECYYEPFAGRGNAFFYMAAYKKFNMAYLNDLYLSEFLIALRDYDGDYSFVPEFIDRKIYDYFDKMESCFEKTLAESFCAYNGTFFGEGANITNSPSAPSKNKHSAPHTILRMREAKKLLQNIPITSLDYLEFLNTCKFKYNDLIYFDPPYQGSSKRSLVGPEIDPFFLVILKTAHLLFRGYLLVRRDAMTTRQHRNSAGGSGQVPYMLRAFHKRLEEKITELCPSGSTKEVDLRSLVHALMREEKPIHLERCTSITEAIEVLAGKGVVRLKTTSEGTRRIQMRTEIHSSRM